MLFFKRIAYISISVRCIDVITNTHITTSPVHAQASSAANVRLDISNSIQQYMHKHSFKKCHMTLSLTRPSSTRLTSGTSNSSTRLSSVASWSSRLGIWDKKWVRTRRSCRRRKKQENSSVWMLDVAWNDKCLLWEIHWLWCMKCKGIECNWSDLVVNNLFQTHHLLVHDVHDEKAGDVYGMNCRVICKGSDRLTIRVFKPTTSSLAIQKQQ